MGDPAISDAKVAEAPSADDASDVAAEESAAPPRPRRRGWRRLVRVRRFVRRSFWSLVVLLLVVVALASQTGRGQELVLRTALNEVRSALAGELRIEGIRSGTLLTGATLRGVRLLAAGGRPFLAADSVVLRYSLLAALTGGPPVRSTTVWGADIVVSRYDDDEPVNVSLLLAEGDSASSSRSRTPTRLGHIAIRRGQARILTPADPAEGPPDVEGPEGQPLNALTFDGLDLDVENATLVPGGSVVFRADLASFSSAIGILDEPIRVREVFGALTYGDQGIRIAEAQFRLPGTLLEGDLRVGPERAGEPWSFWTRLESDGWGDLSDVAWIDARIPSGRFRGAAEVGVDDGGVAVGLDELRVELEASDVLFDGRAVFTDRMTLDGMDVLASPVTLERLEPWLEREIPMDGWISGEGVFSGTLDDLEGSGRMTLVPTGFGGAATTVDFSGGLRRGEALGARDLRARFDPMNYTILEAFWPQLPWAGSGSAVVELDGAVQDSLRLFVDLQHTTAEGAVSGVRAEGALSRGEEGRWLSDLTLDLQPLSVSMFASLAPRFGLGGDVSGPARVQGSLDDLSVQGELETELGRVEVDGRVNLLRPSSGYRMALAADSFPLSRFSDRLPDRTHWSGRLTVEGSGFSLDSADVAVTVDARASRVGPVRVDTVAAAGRIRSGVLVTERLQATVGGIDVSGRGRLGLRPGRWGSSSLDFSAASLEGLRPWLMGIGDSVLVRDELSALDRELLRVQGIEPDTLPTRRDVRFDGRLTGSASISGDIRDMDLGLIAEVVGGTYRQSEVDSAQIAFSATGLPSTRGDWEVGASAVGVVIDDRTFDRGGFEADMTDREGTGRVEVVRRPGEEYRARGDFALDSAGGGRVELESGSLRVDDQLWEVTHAGLVRWGPSELTVDSLEVVREGADPMRMVVDGDLTRGGQSDFRLLLEGLHVERLLHVAQLDELEVGGHLDADLSVRGTADAPIIEGVFSSLGPRYGALQLTRLDGSIAYADRRAAVAVEGWDRTRRVVTATGTLPLDLGLVDVEDRVLEAPMDVELAADSLDAAIALSFLSSLDGVLGTISGDVRIGGTPQAPEPEGTITLRDGAWSIEAIGVRHTGVGGELVLNPDRTVDVSLEARGPGRSEVTGTVLLDPLSDPELDLDFDFTRFLAVSRADMEGWVSGSFNLGGTYTRPVAEGALRVDEATIFVDELQRAANVVDLSDPFLFDAGLAVDTTALVSQPLFAGLRNPFFDNLRVDVDLSVPRGAWLRSIDTNVELSGDLLVRYDRSAGDFVLIGELAALRGSHQVLGRNFQLQGGTVSFIGRPGLNPDLDIEASTRIRVPGESNLVVDAQVTGTLVQPVVTLSSEESGLAEQDLISYIVFGQPSGALGGRSGASGRLQELNAVSSAVQGSVTYFGGALANQLGTALARELPLTFDYVSVQGAQTLDRSAVANTFSQVELGRYIGDDVFVIVVLRPFDAGPQDQNNVAGLRVEVALTDDYNVEVFREDRFLRSGSTGLRTSSSLIDDDEIVGIFLFREWGYSPTRDR